MDPQLVEKGPIRLVGVLSYGKPDQLDYNDIWANQFMAYDGLLKAHSIDQAYYGAWFGEKDGAYLAAMAVDEALEIPAGLEVRTIPASQFAVFPCLLSTISATYGEIFQRWLPASPFEFSPGASDFEYYPPHAEAGDFPAAIYVPVRLKEKQSV